MSVFIAIKTCAARRAWRDAQRASWLKDLPGGWNYCYFIGRLETDEPDVAGVDAPDNLPGIALKLAAGLRCIMSGPTSLLPRHVFVCDDDTYVALPRLVASGFESHDYAGFARAPHSTNCFVPYAQGSAFWLSRRAIEFVLTSGCMTAGRPDDWAVGLVLAGKVELFDDRRYEPGPNRPRAPLLGNDVISTHKCDPRKMHDAHQNWMKSQEESHGKA